MRHRARPLLVLLFATSLVAVACGGGNRPQLTTPRAKATLTGGLNVFAASSLTEVFTALGHAFEQKNPGVRVVANFNFAASSALAQQVNDGAPADIFVSADEANMVKVVSAGNAGNAVAIARNQLSLTEITVYPA